MFKLLGKAIRPVEGNSSLRWFIYKIGEDIYGLGLYPRGCVRPYGIRFDRKTQFAFEGLPAAAKMTKYEEVKLTLGQKRNLFHNIFFYKD